jgi:hypothetical protein
MPALRFFTPAFDVSLTAMPPDRCHAAEDYCDVFIYDCRLLADMRS